jgi:hypothetical protein
MATHHLQRIERRTRKFVVNGLRAYVLEHDFEPIPPVLRNLLRGDIWSKYGLQGPRVSSEGAIYPRGRLLWGV